MSNNIERSMNLLAEIRANRDKLDACTGHRFAADDVNAAIKATSKDLQYRDVTCVICGGNLKLELAEWYARGYEAAGGNPNDVIAGFKTDEEVCSNRFNNPLFSAKSLRQFAEKYHNEIRNDKHDFAEVFKREDEETGRDLY